MSSRTIDDLAFDLRQRRLVGDPQPALLLGAGASVDAGIGAMPELYALAGVPDFPAFAAFIEQRTEDERFRLLVRFLQTLRPQDVTPGYQALAALCEEGYLDLILTTNLDPLLDDALAAARMWRKDFLLLVNGVLRGDRLAPLLRAPMPRVKVLKLHGDLFHRYMAWTESEMAQFVADLDPGLFEALSNRDLLVVGHSLRDARIADIALRTVADKRVVWYTHPERGAEVLGNNKHVREVIDPACTFESLFTSLARKLDLVSDADSAKRARSTLPPAIRSSSASSMAAVDLAHADPRAQTLDDLVAAVVGIGEHEGRPVGTGVLINKPRGILCDRYVLGNTPPHGRVRVRTKDGRSWDVAILCQLTKHPFGPVLLEAPEQWTAHPVDVEARPVGLAESLRAAVFAGEKPGVSTGAVADLIEMSMRIDPVGIVDGLVGLRLAVAPGSSGAPVVDSAFLMRGFIVAGSSDLTQPEAYMYPASRWHSPLLSEWSTSLIMRFTL